MAYELSDSSDVTLAMKDANQPVCKFHQNGHCKFGNICRHYHTQHTCATIQCPRTECSSRHPRPCLYFLRSGYCKFGATCSYAHSNPVKPVSKHDKEILELKEKLEKVILNLKENEIELNCLKEKVSIMEERSISPSRNIKCEICPYEASSKTVLKCHITRKHKHEIMRSSSHNESYELSPEVFQEEYETNPDSPISSESMNDEEACEECGESVLEDDMDAHRWYFHKESSCTFNNQGSNCTLYPSENPIMHSMWTVSCDNCWAEVLDKFPDHLSFGPCEATEQFKIQHPQFFSNN